MIVTGVIIIAHMANDIKKHPVPLIFKKILKDRMSGVLHVTSENLVKKIYFFDGNLVYARTTSPNERLGEVLLSMGKISSIQLENAMKIKKSLSSSNQRLGEILLEISNLDIKDIYPAVVKQLTMIAASTFSLKTGQWRFVIDHPVHPEKRSIRIKLPEVIRVGVELIGDMTIFKNRFNYRAPITTRIPDSIRKTFTAEQMEFYDHLAGFAHTPLIELVPGEKDRKDTFWKNILFFYLLNVLDFVEFTVDEERNKNIEELNSLYDKLDESSADYYGLFGLKLDAKPEDIKQVYFDYSHKFHPDRINAAPDSTVMLKANAVFAEINAGFSILGNAEKRIEYDRQRYAPGGKDNAVEDNNKKARQLYLKGNTLFKKQYYQEAIAVLEEAVRIDSSRANYFLLLGLCQTRVESARIQAKDNLMKAAALEPWNADPVFALGELYRSENLLKNAEACFKKALEINMEHALAGKAIDELEKMKKDKRARFSLFKKKQ